MNVWASDIIYSEVMNQVMKFVMSYSENNGMPRYVCFGKCLNQFMFFPEAHISLCQWTRLAPTLPVALHHCVPVQSCHAHTGLVLIHYKTRKQTCKQKYCVHTMHTYTYEGTKFPFILLLEDFRQREISSVPVHLGHYLSDLAETIIVACVFFLYKISI